ncbi:hypothetical protein GCM10022280_13160 [Sphingomonas swuensis]|uniref:Uncharacterized protein n=1 Tax=Sphingomonas swuensis TaxID=977800 RepID=A0ABP7SS09_9SPHN
MQIDPKTPAGGGCLIFLGFLAGATIGILKDEPSLGVIIGVAGGALVALLLYLVGRLRRG